MSILNFNLDTAGPHPAFEGVLVYPILDEREGFGIRSNYAFIKPGFEISPHTHDVVEVFTIISGNAEVLQGEKWIPVTVGSTIIAPPGEIHGVRNSTSENVILQANFNCK